MTPALPATFLAALDRLRTWQQSTGLLDPPAATVAPDGFALGQWLAQQRHRHRRGQLSAARGAALEAAGITWEFTTYRTSPEITGRWWKHLQAVTKFATLHARAPRVTDRGADGLNLGDWLGRQRDALAAGRLTAEQVTGLDALPFPWRIPNETGRWAPDENGFALRLAALAAYAAEHGHADPPQSHRTSDGFALGQWLADQRWYRRRGTLAPHREQALADLRITWDPPHTRRTTATPPADSA